jgi:hypothetical protein
MVERAILDTSVTRAAKLDMAVGIDHGLPGWARRSNPIVRRHLGFYWKTLPPEIGQLVKIYLVQIGLMLLSFPFPIFFDFVMPVITVSLLLIPVAFIGYGHALLFVGIVAVTATVDERRNHTLDLLRTTPLPLEHIVFSKIAAAIWRQVDDLGLILMTASLLTLPVMVIQYANLFPPAQYPIICRAAIVLGVTASLLRLALEPVMIGALGVMVGAAAPQRIPAITATALMGGFYFLLLNLPRLMVLGWETRLLIEVALPLILPPVIAFICIKLTLRFLQRD